MTDDYWDIRERVKYFSVEVDPGERAITWRLVLEHLLNDSDVQIRDAALHALTTIASPSSKPALLARLTVEGNSLMCTLLGVAIEGCEQ